MINRMKGHTQDVANYFLGSEFWRPGTRVSGSVTGQFESANDTCYALGLDQQVELGGRPTIEVALGNLTRLRMQSKPLLPKTWKSESIALECTALQPIAKAIRASSLRSKFRGSKITGLF
jgi:hypothetical protein